MREDLFDNLIDNFFQSNVYNIFCDTCEQETNVKGFSRSERKSSSMKAGGPNSQLVREPAVGGSTADTMNASLNLEQKSNLPFAQQSSVPPPVWPQNQVKFSGNRKSSFKSKQDVIKPSNQSITGRQNLENAPQNSDPGFNLSNLKGGSKQEIAQTKHDLLAALSRSSEIAAPTKSELLMARRKLRQEANSSLEDVEVGLRPYREPLASRTESLDKDETNMASSGPPTNILLYGGLQRWNKDRFSLRSEPDKYAELSSHHFHRWSLRSSLSKAAKRRSAHGSAGQKRLRRSASSASGRHPPGDASDSIHARPRLFQGRKSQRRRSMSRPGYVAEVGSNGYGSGQTGLDKDPLQLTVPSILRLQDNRCFNIRHQIKLNAIGEETQDRLDDSLVTNSLLDLTSSAASQATVKSGAHPVPNSPSTLNSEITGVDSDLQRLGGSRSMIGSAIDQGYHSRETSSGGLNGQGGSLPSGRQRKEQSDKYLSNRLGSDITEGPSQAPRDKFAAQASSAAFDKVADRSSSQVTRRLSGKRKRRQIRRSMRKNRSGRKSKNSTRSASSREGVESMKHLWERTGMKTNGRKLLIDSDDQAQESDGSEVSVPRGSGVLLGHRKNASQSSTSTAMSAETNTTEPEDSEARGNWTTAVHSGYAEESDSSTKHVRFSSLELRLGSGNFQLPQPSFVEAKSLNSSEVVGGSSQWSWHRSPTSGSWKAEANTSIASVAGVSYSSADTTTASGSLFFRDMESGKMTPRSNRRKWCKLILQTLCIFMMVSTFLLVIISLTVFLTQGRNHPS